MSATLGDISEIAADLTRRNGRETAIVDDAERPVPLTFSWAMTHLSETLTELVTTHQAPVYVVHFTQAAAVEHATSLLGAGTGIELTRDARDAINQRLVGLPLRRGLRQEPAQARPPRHRRPPRRDAAALPPPGGAAGPGRPAGGHLRHRHPRRRHQRADPDRAVHRAREVRRHPAADPALARVPPDRRPRRSRRLRHRGVRRRPGARARDRQRQGAREGRATTRRSSAAYAARSRPTGRSCGPRRPSRSWWPDRPSS